MRSKVRKISLEIAAHGILRLTPFKRRRLGSCNKAMDVLSVTVVGVISHIIPTQTTRRVRESRHSSPVLAALFRQKCPGLPVRRGPQTAFSAEIETRAASAKALPGLRERKAR